MRKSVVMALAGGMTLGIATVALADQHDPNLDQVINIGNFTLGGGQSTNVIVGLEANNNTVVGFTFTGTVAGISGNDQWASDLRLDIVAPGGQTYAVGGYDNPANLWAYQGAGSTNNGTYSDTHFVDLGPKGGEWSFTFTNDWGGSPFSQEWSNVSITLHKIPAPGALALLGVAGLVGARRRRR